MQMIVEQMNKFHCLRFLNWAVNCVIPRLGILQWLLVDTVKILEHSMKYCHDLADVDLSFALPPYLSPLLPAMLNVVIVTATHKYFQLLPASGRTVLPSSVGWCSLVTYFGLWNVSPKKACPLASWQFLKRRCAMCHAISPELCRAIAYVLESCCSALSA